MPWGTAIRCLSYWSSVERGGQAYRFHLLLCQWRSSLFAILVVLGMEWDRLELVELLREDDDWCVHQCSVEWRSSLLATNYDRPSIWFARYLRWRIECPLEHSVSNHHLSDHNETTLSHKSRGETEVNGSFESVRCDPYITRWWLTSIAGDNFECYTTTRIFLQIEIEKLNHTRSSEEPTSICCRYWIGWLETFSPLISLISSPTWRVPCRCIIPPFRIRDTIHRLFSVIRSVMPWNT